MNVPTEALVKIYEKGKEAHAEYLGDPEEMGASVPMYQMLAILKELIARRMADTTDLAASESEILFLMTEAVIESLKITTEIEFVGTDLFPPLDPGQWDEYYWNLNESLEDGRDEGLCIHEKSIRPFEGETISNYASRLTAVDHGDGLHVPADPSLN